MDRSFHGLVLSIIIHLLVVWILLRVPAPAVQYASDPVEIQIVDNSQEPTAKAKAFVTETEKDEQKVFDQLKEQADFLSKYTKRVKKQMKARDTGPTQNATQAQTAPPTERRQGVAGMQPRREQEEGVGLPLPGGTQAMRNVVIGSSTIAEHIPGVEEGAFTALNTDQFTYYAFFARMNEQVRNRWVTAVRQYMDRLTRADLEQLSRMDRHTVVEIVLASDGAYETALLHQSSGDRYLDQTTVLAFKNAAPFLNPPRGMIDDDGKIRLKYGFMVRFKPPTFGPAPQ